uniref:Uncharacterized protein n=1 Tax=Plectus sambesii TaxID=2011161 RepID=A0A914UY67_9BILA
MWLPWVLLIALVALVVTDSTEVNGATGHYNRYGSLTASPTHALQEAPLWIVRDLPIGRDGVMLDEPRKRSRMLVAEDYLPTWDTPWDVLMKRDEIDDDDDAMKPSDLYLKRLRFLGKQKYWGRR